MTTGSAPAAAILDKRRGGLASDSLMNQFALKSGRQEWRRMMPQILQNHYVLAVHDLRKSARFFVDSLGFEVTAEPPGWVFVKKDDCMVMLGECPDALPASELGDHSYFGYLRVDDAACYYDDLKTKGVEILSPLADKPWGMREFALRTPEGHRMTIGQWLNGEHPS